MANIKGYIVVASLTAFVSWIAFSPDDESPRHSKLESETERGLRALPQKPEPLPPPRERHGIVGSSGTPASSYYRPNPYGYDYGQPQAPVRYHRPAEPGSVPMERFSFRPLTERERERVEAERPAPGYYPESMAPPPRTYSRSPGARNGYGGRSIRPSSPQTTLQPEWYGRGYSFRPEAQPSNARDHWRGPYSDHASPGWHQAPESAIPWTDPSSPQWGSRPPPDWTPPAERMYPSVVPYSDRTLTSR